MLKPNEKENKKQYDSTKSNQLRKHKKGHQQNDTLQQIKTPFFF